MKKRKNMMRKARENMSMIDAEMMDRAINCLYDLYLRKIKRRKK